MNAKEIIISGIVGAVIGVPVGILIQEPLQAALNHHREEKRLPEKILEQANADRELMTTAGFEAARSGYQSLLDRPHLASQIKLQAYEGMSRAYSDWAISRFWRGLSHTAYTKTAEDYAALAEKEAPGNFKTQLAFAYAGLSREVVSLKGTADRERVNGLSPGHADDPDVRYLAWTAGLEQQPSFADTAEPQKMSSLPMLLHLASYFGNRALAARTSDEKFKALGRAEAFLDRADSVAPDNELVFFQRGVVLQIKNQWADAADYYQKALNKAPEFPRARDGLAGIYGANHEYDKALGQLLSVVSIEDAPADSRATAFGNLGEVYLELGNRGQACSAWKLASELDEKHRLADEEHLLVQIHTAMCSYVNDQLPTAKGQYIRAIELGKRQKLTLTTLKVYQDKWKVGPQESDVAQKLIELASGSVPESSSARLSPAQ